MPILNFKCKKTLSLHNGERVVEWKSFERAALRKLEQLNIAIILGDLRIPPGNHLELLIGNRKGQHSIRINDQWRICFIWQNEGPTDVEIVDYH
jgi:toxin HigB-1